MEWWFVYVGEVEGLKEGEVGEGELPGLPGVRQVCVVLSFSLPDLCCPFGATQLAGCTRHA